MRFRVGGLNLPERRNIYTITLLVYMPVAGRRTWLHVCMCSCGTTIIEEVGLTSGESEILRIEKQEERDALEEIDR